MEYADMILHNIQKSPQRFVVHSENFATLVFAEFEISISFHCSVLYYKKKLRWTG